MDSTVAARFRDGDPDAVREVYRQYGGLVYAVVRRALGNKDLADEATQQTFVQAWRAASSFDAGRDLGPWLVTIARRVAIDIHRRESRRQHERLDDVPASAPPVVASPPSLERSFAVWEVRQALTELPEDERRVVELQHLEGLTHAEIAEQMDIPIGTVKSRSFRAHRRLAARLGYLREEP